MQILGVGVLMEGSETVCSGEVGGAISNAHARHRCIHVDVMEAGKLARTLTV